MNKKKKGVDYKEIKTVTMNGVPGIMRVDPKFSKKEVFKRVFDIEVEKDVLYPQRDDMLSLENLETELGIVEENWKRFQNGEL